MMNRKVTALLIIALASTGLLAKRCYNKYGKRISCRSKDVVTRTGTFVGDTARGAGDTALNILTLGGHQRAKDREAMEDEMEDSDDYDMVEEE